jgi:GNAT superfamily N-acetyltransferase
VSRVEIRTATAADAAALLGLIRELAEYEREPDAVQADEQSIAAALSGPDPVARALVAVDPGALDPGALDPGAVDPGAVDTDIRTPVAVVGEAPVVGTATVVGMALWFRTFSTWTGRPGMWLEDLYVRPSHRRGGLGRALLQRLAAECVANGWSRLEWTVLDWNTPAQAFYRSLGAVPTDGWTTNRVTGTALTSLATASTAAPSLVPPSLVSPGQPAQGFSDAR